MLADVKSRTFQPDLPRAHRIAQGLGLEDAAEGEPSPESDCSEGDVREADLVRDAPVPRHRAPWDDFPSDDLGRLRIHTYSGGVVHVLADDIARFLCGRRHTANFQDLPQGTRVAELPACRQCRR